MRLGEWLSELGRRSRMLFSRRERFDREMEEEMGLHRELRAQEIHEENGDASGSPEDSAYAAQRQFGNTLQLR